LTIDKTPRYAADKGSESKWQGVEEFLWGTRNHLVEADHELISVVVRSRFTLHLYGEDQGAGCIYKQSPAAGIFVALLLVEEISAYSGWAGPR